MMNVILLHELTKQLTGECHTIISDQCVRQAANCKHLPELTPLTGTSVP